MSAQSVASVEAVEAARLFGTSRRVVLRLFATASPLKSGGLSSSASQFDVQRFATFGLRLERFCSRNTQSAFAKRLGKIVPPACRGFLAVLSAWGGAVTAAAFWFVYGS